MGLESKSFWLPASLCVALVAACEGEVEIFEKAPPFDAGSQDSGQDAQGGTGGSSGAPNTFVHTDKVDLLFMLDNSASMADKQSVLADTIPALITRLTSPLCVDEVGGYVAQVSAGQACPDGSAREFPAVTDMHIGVITSSLGGHGADSCSEQPAMNWNERQVEMAHLISRGKDESGSETTVDTYEGLGFLNWDPNGQDTPVGEQDSSNLSVRFAQLARGAGQDGCGFESSLEAWYRFLVDPAPHESMVPVPCNASDTSNNCRGPEGLDEVILQQREDFLRQDSVVAIVMLTDENDCSIIDEGQNYLAAQSLDGTGQFHIAPGTNACETDPSSSDCKSCWQVNSADYPECQLGWSDPEHEDALNLRCYRQKQRFGIDFLQPVERYVAALTETHLDDGQLNPLFCKTPEVGGTQCSTDLRSRSQIVLTAIIGVPWQDIAIDPQDLSAGYKRADDIDWDLVLGDPENQVEPTDPHMIESVAPALRHAPYPGYRLGLAR